RINVAASAKPAERVRYAMPVNAPQASSHHHSPAMPLPTEDGGNSKYKSNIQNDNRARKINNGSLMAAACTCSISPLPTNKAARTSPPVSEGVMRQARTPNKPVFKPNKIAFTKRVPRSGSKPNRPKNASTAEKPGGKWVTGPLLASQASRYPLPAS